MTFEDYQRNVRGVNDGSDFPVEYLVSRFFLCHTTDLEYVIRGTFMTRYEKAKLYCLKNILGS